jgi:hypothetical protein
MARIARFLRLLFSFSFKRGQMIAKFAPPLIALVLGYAFWETPVRVLLFGRTYHFHAGAALVVVAVISLTLLRAGDAWRESAVAELTFGECSVESNSFWVEIRNLGYVDSGVTKIWLTSAVNSDGAKSSKTSLPIPIETLIHGVIARGHSAVKLGTVAVIDDFYPRLSVSGTDPSGKNTGVDFTLSGVEWAGTANRIYITVSISHASRRSDMCYELQSMCTTSPHIAVRAVGKPLREQHIRQQRAKLGVPLTK